jgi:hypothetical protein
MDEEGCDCEKCKLKRKYRLEGVTLVEQKIEEKFSKSMYSMGMPKTVLKSIIESAKEEVK